MILNSLCYFAGMAAGRTKYEHTRVARAHLQEAAGGLHPSGHTETPRSLRIMGRKVRDNAIFLL